jgi:hypothetical protein
MERFARYRGELLHADTPDAVAALIGECMRSIPPEMVAVLPPPCQNVLRNPTGDIQGAAVELLRVELKYTGRGDDLVLLKEISQTYAVASARLARP